MAYFRSLSLAAFTKKSSSSHLTPYLQICLSTSQAPFPITSAIAPRYIAQLFERIKCYLSPKILTFFDFYNRKRTYTTLYRRNGFNPFCVLQVKTNEILLTVSYPQPIYASPHLPIAALWPYGVITKQATYLAQNKCQNASQFAYVCSRKMRPCSEG